MATMYVMLLCVWYVGTHNKPADAKNVRQSQGDQPAAREVQGQLLIMSVPATTALGAAVCVFNHPR